MIDLDALPPMPAIGDIGQFITDRRLPSLGLCDLIADYGRRCFEAGRNNADAKDAARYRWLRKVFPAIKAWPNDFSVDFIEVDKDARFTKYDPATLDAAIDKASKEMP